MSAFTGWVNSFYHVMLSAIKKWQQHCQTSSILDTTRSQKKSATKGYLEKRLGVRNGVIRIQVQLEDDGGGGSRQNLNTCWPTANPSPAFLVVATCDRLTVVISTSHVWNLLRTEDVHLHTPAPQTWTHFLLTLETIVFLFHLLSATSKLFSSLSTRLAHTMHLGFYFFLTKMHYINSLLLLLLTGWRKVICSLCSTGSNKA